MEVNGMSTDALRLADALEEKDYPPRRAAAAELRRLHKENERLKAASTAQRKEWQGLTDDEIKEIIGSWAETPIKGYTRKLFDQIEAKLKEKNT